jgi:hypothetical protein
MPGQFGRVFVFWHGPSLSLDIGTQKKRRENGFRIENNHSRPRVEDRLAITRAEWSLKPSPGKVRLDLETLESYSVN